MDIEVNIPENIEDGRKYTLSVKFVDITPTENSGMVSFTKTTTKTIEVLVGEYEKKLFQIGWWGQGIKEAGYYIKNTAPRGSMIGIALAPPHVFPNLKDYKTSIFTQEKKYDYVIVNDYAVLRYNFNDNFIKRDYKLTYVVTADRAVLVSIYRSKSLNTK